MAFFDDLATAITQTFGFLPLELIAVLGLFFLFAELKLSGPALAGAAFATLFGLCTFGSLPPAALSGAEILTALAGAWLVAELLK